MGGADGPDVAVIGLGYVGLTLAAALADAGVSVLGHDANPDVNARVAAGEPHVHEPGLAEALARVADGRRLRVVDELPATLPRDVVVTVGTPVRGDERIPDLTQVRAAAEAIAPRIADDTLVALRSTVPVGACRHVVHATLARHVDAPLVAFCPERTIQGIALDELRELPQVVAGIDERARERARRLFERLSPHVVEVSSLETAELVKLICNAHTDVIYSFGNEVAAIAESLGVDAAEAIAAANIDYPRPDIARPGFVGGSCLTKDPWILVHSVRANGAGAPLVATARRRNEELVERVAARVLDELRRARGEAAERSVVALCGVAFKGRPATDDVRGAPAAPLARALGEHVGAVRGHDFVADDAAVASLGLEPAPSLRAALDGSDAALILNDHPGYAADELRDAVAGMRRPAVVFDVWGVCEDGLSPAPDGVRYARLGRG